MKKLSKPVKNIAALKSVAKLIKSSHPEVILSKIRLDLQPDYYSYVIDSILSIQTTLTKSKLAHRFANVLHKPTIQSLNKAPIPAAINFEKELQWAKNVFTKLGDKLSLFVELKSKYSMSLLDANYDNALLILNEIEEGFGISIWSIKCRIALLQLAQNFEAQKKYAQSIKEQCQYRGPIAFITHWTSIRNENTVTPTRFNYDYTRLIENRERRYPNGWRAFLQYHILSPDQLRPDNAIDVLRIESSHSIIDYYEAFISLSSSFILLGYPAQRAALENVLKLLTERVSDTALKFHYNILTKGAMEDPKINSPAYIMFLNGKYDEAIQYIDNNDLNLPDIGINGVIKSLCKGIIDDLKHGRNIEFNENDSDIDAQATMDISSKLALIIKGGASESNELNDLIKLSKNFATFSWASSPTLLLVDEMSSVPQENDDILATAALKMSDRHPMLLNIIRERIDSQRISESSFNEESRDLTFQNNPNDFSNEMKLLLSGTQNYKIRSFLKAAEIGKELTKSEISYFRRRGYRLLTNALLDQNLFEQAFEEIACAYVSEPSIYPMLPLAKAAGDLHPRSDKWKRLRTFMSLSIVLDAYTKNINPNAETRSSYAYEDFIDFNGMIRPSELKDKITSYDTNQLIYFLKNLCVESIMDGAISYIGSSDLLLERLEVCRILVELEPNNNDYKDEIKALHQTLVVRRRKKEVDQSRIYVDITKLNAWASRELTENFKRYTIFLKSGLDVNTTAFQTQAIAKAEEFDIKGLMAMSVPENEPNAIFRQIALDIQNAYSSNADFGLNRYLSTRVRHGALNNQLRKPLAAQHLIGTRKNESSPYIADIYWVTKLNLEGQERITIEACFSNFSKAFDKLIDNIKTNWLQIRKGVDGIGFFDFNLSDGEIAIIASEVTQSTPFKLLLDSVVELLNYRLSASLALVRKNLVEIAKIEARKLLNKLQEQIVLISEKNYRLSEIEAAINLARTDLDSSFDRIAEWFKPTKTIGTSPYALQDVITVADEFVKEASPKFKVLQNIIGEMDLQMPARGFTTLVDVFVNLFENIISHSGLDSPEASVEVNNIPIKNNVSETHISVSNSISPNVDLNSLQNELNVIKSKLLGDEYKDTIASEGGSGLFKVRACLKDFRFSDRDPEPSFDFSVEGHKFVVNISIQVRWTTEVLSSNIHDVENLLNM